MKNLLPFLFCTFVIPVLAVDYDDPELFEDDFPAAATVRLTPRTAGTYIDSGEFEGYYSTYGDYNSFGYQGSYWEYGSRSGYWREDYHYYSTSGDRGNFTEHYSDFFNTDEFGMDPYYYESGGFWYVYGGRLDIDSDTASSILQEVVEKARTGDTILVGPGVYGPIKTDNKDITIQSIEGKRYTFIDGCSSRRCVEVGANNARKTKIKGFSLVYGYAENGGGCLGGTLSECYIGCCGADNSGGGAYGASLTDCIIVGNWANGRFSTGDGGGAYNCILNRCDIQCNMCGPWPASWSCSGAGICKGTAYNCLLANNFNLRGDGGGASNATLVNCTVCDNSAEEGGGVSGCTVYNSIVSGNDVYEGRMPNYKRSSFQYSLSYPVPSGKGNFNVAPGFVDRDGGNYHLSNTSKCRDKGKASLNTTPYDLAGLPRKMGKSVDVGCYEYATAVNPLDPSDYDGDSIPDLGLYDPSTGVWYIRQTATDTVRRSKLGFVGVKTVPMDHDGDGVTDIAIYNPSSGYWQIRHSYSGRLVTVRHGWKGINLVAAADCDGDGRSDLILCNPANGIWQILRSSDDATEVVRWRGWNGITLVCGDYDGDGCADLAFYSPSSFTWYIRKSSTGKEQILALGASGDRICPGDYDHDGCLEPTVYRPSTGQWSSRKLSSGKISTVKFGDKTITPHSVDWNNDGVPDTRAFYSPYRAGWLDLFTEADGSRTVYMTNF